jgi:single-stranded-DNA-specific exonuclease
MARALARKLVELNEQRKYLQDELTMEILCTLPERMDDPIVFSSGENWHLGLLGLTANNLMGMFSKPTFVCSIQPDGVVRGSCRSQKSYSLSGVKEIQKQHGILTRLGGHDQAFGFELESQNILVFRELLNQCFGELPNDEGNYLEIDARMPWNKISLDTYGQIAEISPFGMGNPEPLFLSENLVVEQSVVLGEGKHLKLMLSNPSSHKVVEGIWWRNGGEADHFRPGTKVDAVYKLGVNEFRGEKNMQLVIEDLQTAE